ncbi:formyltetrahydrofolate-dependent phosphoribosylglycinamide formyltransferase [Rivularia sp. PCC 7116]|uniref:phosphoribosylglycinamide formyltransferase n=1 Tax=Rivularia sp. PCC 7116 TaxID=373994 RepID=UPI00029ED9C3|nr:phosphoribosylglycinamide formyltransferase [Rivularia sp. PCC 7116]AFY58799.1 formyltetrahydrofolate-dependent phosphoribosylglycinamide formyltransferase [Rivularia sp. PCC 7116]
MISVSPSLISPNIPTHSQSSNKPVKLGIMASGSGSNFEAVAQAIENGQLNAEIKVLIYNNPDAYAAVRADKRNIAAVLINHRDYKHREELDKQIVQTLCQHDVEWVIMAGWMRLVTQELIDAFPQKIINIHPSLLPSFKGVKAIEQAIKAQVKITGCTVHLVSLEMDSGKILMQAAVAVLPDDTPDTLHTRIQIQEHRILPAAIALAVNSEQ